MARLTEDAEESLGEAGDQPVLSLREMGAQTVRALSETGAALFPLRAKRDGGRKLTKREQQRLSDLETAYRDLEQDLRELMRPRERNPWLQGRDHAHGPRMG